MAHGPANVLVLLGRPGPLRRQGGSKTRRVVWSARRIGSSSQLVLSGASASPSRLGIVALRQSPKRKTPQAILIQGCSVLLVFFNQSSYISSHLSPSKANGEAPIGCRLDCSIPLPPNQTNIAISVTVPLSLCNYLFQLFLDP